MPKDDSENGASTNTPKIGGKDIPCPGCGGPLEDNYEGGGSYRCPDCDWEWETWEVLDSMRDK
jgi:tRNA(Ile2) C34 agmatinyltransferase TiaS